MYRLATSLCGLQLLCSILAFLKLHCTNLAQRGLQLPVVVERQPVKHLIPFLRKQGWGYGEAKLIWVLDASITIKGGGIVSRHQPDASTTLAVARWGYSNAMNSGGQSS